MTCKTFPSFQGKGRRRSARTTVTRVSLCPTKATLSSYVPHGWPLGCVMTLRSYWSQHQTPLHSVLEEWREGWCLHLASGHPPCRLIQA